MDEYEHMLEQIKIISFSDIPNEFKLEFINDISTGADIGTIATHNVIKGIKNYVLFIGGEDKIIERKKAEWLLWFLSDTRGNEKRIEIMRFIENKYSKILSDNPILRGMRSNEYIYYCLRLILKTDEIQAIIKKFWNDVNIEEIIENNSTHGSNCENWNLSILVWADKYAKLL